MGLSTTIPRTTPTDSFSAGAGFILSWRRPLIIGSQAALVVLSYYFSFLLRFDFSPAAQYLHLFWLTLPLVVAVKLALFYIFGLLRGWWRYVGVSDALDITKAASLSTIVLFILLIVELQLPGYPRSVLCIDFVLTVLTVGGARVAVRAYTETGKQASSRHTLVIGAGNAGRTTVRELKRNLQLGMKPVGFVDDDATKHGIRIEGVPVLGPADNLAAFIRKYSVECVLIAIPSATGSQVQRFISKCRECRVEFKILPPIRQHINGARAGVTGVRKVQLEDLLGRKPVSVNLESIRKQLENRVLLITGAAGSIGSELARQVAKFAPRELLLVDRSENCLFKLGHELTANLPHQHFVPIVADIQDVNTMREVFAVYRPEVVFHAAAYKHVPMMERNCFQAVMNNVFGTYNVALLARQFAVEHFVMISSDKAVNPANIMGVTKRVAELIMLNLNGEGTRFVAVRFGNVLGSNGSVVPIFEQQIAEGGPITVTHPEAKRYFMSIPESVELVLQASTMGNGGEIFVLDMGEPIKIVELARNLIRLSGLEPDKDVQVVFTGIRPGEKLFEELKLDGEDIKPTAHEKIRVLNGGGQMRFRQVQEWLEELSAAAEVKNVSALISTLQRIVPEYQPSEEVRALCQVDRHDVRMLYRKAQTKLWYAGRDAA